MAGWDWLENLQPGWGFVGRVLVKAALLFALCNLVYALVTPLHALGQISLYNTVFPGRPRLPYGENPSRSYNLSLFNLPAMFASHTVAQPPAEDTFRVLLLGDSNAWGWLLENESTLAAQLNRSGYRTPAGRRVVVYNIGYPVMSLTKDLMLLDYALRYDADMVVWVVTLQSFPREKQVFPPLVQHNAARVRRLIEAYDLDIDPTDSRFVEPDFIDRTIIGQRRALADLMRLQLYGFSWAATGIDQHIPDEISLRQSDFEADITWEGFDAPGSLSQDDLAFDVLAAGRQLAGERPLLLVNEPIFISSGRNSDLRYNSFYPRWAYDAYREMLADFARDWHYLDVWDRVDPAEFTDSPVHLTPAGTAQLERLVGAAMMDVIERENNDSG